MSKEMPERCQYPRCRKPESAIINLPPRDNNDSTSYYVCVKHYDLIVEQLHNYFVRWKHPKDRRAGARNAESDSSDAASPVAAR